MTSTTTSHNSTTRTGPEPGQAAQIADILAQAGGSLLLEDLKAVAADRAGLAPETVQDAVSREPFAVELDVVRNQMPTSWSARFPWLHTLGLTGDVDSPTGWDLDPPDDPAELTALADTLAQIVLDRLRAVECGRLFPMFHADEPLEEIGFAADRLTNYAKADIETFGAIAGSTMGEFHGLPQTGPVWARANAMVLIRRAAQLPVPDPSLWEGVAPAHPATCGVLAWEKPLAARLESAVACLNDRERGILHARRVTDPPVVFRLLADRYRINGETAERTDHVAARFVTDTVISPALRDKLDTTLPPLGAARPVAEVIAALPGLTKPVPFADGATALQFLSRLTGRYRVVGHTIYPRESGPGVSRVSYGGIHGAERIARILAEHGRPMTKAEISETLNAHDAPLAHRHIDTTLAQDSRFVRHTKWEWMLTEWGLPQFASTQDAMRRMIQQAGGGLTIKVLRKRMHDEYGVSPVTVESYAYQSPFSGDPTSKHGMIRHTGKRPTANRPLTTVPGAFRRPGAWLYRTTFSPGTIRGQGPSAPNPFHSLLTGHDEKNLVWFPTRLGPQKIIASRDTPRLSSLKRFVDDLGLEAREPVFLVFADDGTFDVERPLPPTGHPLTDALRHAGQNDTRLADDVNDAPAAFAALAEAAGLEPSTPALRIATTYNNRGDTEIAALLRQAHRET